VFQVQGFRARNIRERESGREREGKRGGGGGRKRERERTSLNTERVSKRVCV
jgi:hypothetical protein